MSGSFSTPINTALLMYILYTVQSIVYPPAKSSSSSSSGAITDSKTTNTTGSKRFPTEFKNGYTWLPATHPQSVLYKVYTPTTLVPFDGITNPRILLAIGGIVFDVTAGRSFYGPEGMYGNFAGRDASRGMAKQSFDVEMLTPIDQPLDKLEDLRPDEVENMRSWIDHFSSKYIICGKLVENGQA